VLDGGDVEDPGDRSRREHRRLLDAARVVPSVDDHTWTQLLLAYLDGRPKASHILGDYLEGEGLPRIRPADVDQRLRYALGLLPPVLAHEIACDYVQHVLDGHGLLAALLEVKRGWLRGEVTDAALKAARADVQRSRDIGADAAAQAMASSPSPSVAQRASSLSAKLVAVDRGNGAQDRYRGEIRWQASHLRTRL
jgi:hypothetical protein